MPFSPDAPTDMVASNVQSLPYARAQSAPPPKLASLVLRLPSPSFCASPQPPSLRPSSPRWFLPSYVMTRGGKLRPNQIMDGERASTTRWRGSGGLYCDAEVLLSLKCCVPLTSLQPPNAASPASRATAAWSARACCSIPARRRPTFVMRGSCCSATPRGPAAKMGPGAGPCPIAVSA